MRIDQEKCIGCDECHPYCPVGAIRTVEWEGKSVSEIDQVECVECGCCYERSGVCPVDAITMPKLEWPRCIREYFSNPNVKHPSTTGHGRGTEEMKTNDVTGRFTHGFAGVAVEMGRPGVGTSLREMQTVAMAIAKVGVEFESQNPVAELMTDTKTGKFDERVLDERVLSAILELKIPLDKAEGCSRRSQGGVDKDRYGLYARPDQSRQSGWQHAGAGNCRRGRVYPQTQHEDECGPRPPIVQGGIT